MTSPYRRSPGGGDLCPNSDKLSEKFTDGGHRVHCSECGQEVYVRMVNKRFVVHYLIPESEPEGVWWTDEDVVPKYSLRPRLPGHERCDSPNCKYCLNPSEATEDEKLEHFVALGSEDLDVSEYVDMSLDYGPKVPSGAWPDDDLLDPREIAEKAIDLVYGARNDSYGHPADDYGRTAAMWSAYLGTPITPAQAAMCMVLVKISREANKPKPDNRVDAHGYLLVYDRILNRERGRE